MAQANNVAAPKPVAKPVAKATAPPSTAGKSINSGLSGNQNLSSGGSITSSLDKTTSGANSPADSAKTSKESKETLDENWLSPHLFRFGASSLLDDLIRQYIKQMSGHYLAPHDVPRS